MKKFGKAILAVSLVAALGISLAFTGCSGSGSASSSSASASGSASASASGSAAQADSKDIVIWTSGEDYKNEYYLNGLKEKFPELNFTLEYMSSSSIAAKVAEEGDKCEADIILSEEYGYLDKCSDNLAELTDFDYSPFLDEIVPASHKWTPELKNGGCMPSPASSGTGYMFLRQLTNEWGEDAAFDYFTKLADNILQFTTSGSGPVNALVQREVAIGLGMTSQGVVEINDGVNLDIVFFEEGAPYSPTGCAIIAGHEGKAGVQDIFEYLYSGVQDEYLATYLPEQVKIDQETAIENFPENIPYADMSGDTPDVKAALLEKWEF